MKSEEISLHKTSSCLTDGCNHASRDHERNTKLETGHWSGRCLMPDCNCKQYLNEEIKKSIRIMKFFKIAKKEVLIEGFQWEIDMVNERNFNNLNPLGFLNAYAFVVISSGMKNQIADKIYQKLFEHGVETVGHLGKRKAIKWMQSFNKELQGYNYELIFKKLKTISTDTEKIEFLGNLEWIGNITKYHLARNLGIDCAKPDRHLVRLTEQFGYESVHDMCKEVAKMTGERIGTVDVILWRYCNIFGSGINSYKEDFN